MTLKVEGKRAITNPTEEQITHAFSSLTGEGATFAILDRSSQIYIQAGKSEQGFVLEYQEGSVKEHYSSDRTDLSIDDVISAFRDFAAGINSWKGRLTWSKLRKEQNNREPAWVRTASITGFILLIAVGGICVAFGADLDNRMSVLPIALFTLGSYALVMISIPEFFSDRSLRPFRVGRAYAAIFLSFVFTCLLIFQIIRVVMS